LDEDRRQKVEELFRRYGKGVGSYVLAHVGDPHAAESITAGVFLLVVRRFEQCRSSPVAWLWSIVRTELARYFRDKREVGSAKPLSAEPMDCATDPVRLAERAESDERLRAALSRLGEEQQTLIYMKFFLDMPNTDIAEALGMTPGNVGVVVHRAVMRLRELMGASGSAAGGADRDPGPGPSRKGCRDAATPLLPGEPALTGR
jgi:RNA polymerase sigma-70 factor (ECF subfamily)